MTKTGGISLVLLFFFLNIFCMRQPDENESAQDKKAKDISISIPDREEELRSSTTARSFLAGLTLSPKSPKKISSGDSLTNSIKETPITLEEAQKLAKIRSSRLTQSRRPNVVPPFSPDQLEDVQAQQQQRKSQKMFSRDEVDKLVAEAQRQSKIYTEEDVEKILRATSFNEPMLSARYHRLGKEYNVPLCDLPLYAQYLEEVHISPRILAEFVNKKKNEPTDKVIPDPNEVKGFQKIFENDPELYEKLVFAMVQVLMHSADSDNTEQDHNLHPLISDTRVGMLKDTIGSKDDQLFKRSLAIVSVIAGWVCTGVGWIIQWKTSSCAVSPAINGTVT